MDKTTASYHAYAAAQEFLELFIDLMLGVARGHDNNSHVVTHLRNLVSHLQESDVPASVIVNRVLEMTHTKISDFNPDTQSRDSAELLICAVRLSAYLCAEQPRQKTRVAEERSKLTRSIVQFAHELKDREKR